MSATSAQKKRERLARSERLRTGAVEVPHGRLNTYNAWGCRCGPCTQAYMEWYSVYATRKKPTRKRLPDRLAQIAETVSPEVATLIQEQYDDEQARRVGFANRLFMQDGNERDDVA